MNTRSAERLVRAARAAQALSETLWEALHEELGDPVQRRVAELSRRLADVSATVGLLAGVDAGVCAPVESPAAPAQPETRDVPVPAAHDERSGDDPAPAARAPAWPGSAPAPGGAIQAEPTTSRESPATREAGASRAVLVDELAPESPVPESPSAPPEPGARAVQEIEIRDERHDETRPEQAPGADAPGPWIAAIERRLERYERDRAPFAVLVVELADVERLRHAELPGEVSRLTGLVQAALEGELRPADSLTRESPGRYWLLAPETDVPGSRELVGRLAGAVRDAASHRGVPLEVAVGVSVCPADGARAAALAAHAEVALYAARATGRSVT
jgi:GGDEF domain-containing protein